MSAIINYFKEVGNWTGIATSKIIVWLSTLGIEFSVNQGKILNLILILFLIYLVLKILTIGKSLIKYAIVLLLGILGVSTIISFFG